MATESALTSIHRWSAVVLLFAIVFTGAYTIFKVVTGYRDHRDALAVFGRNVRHEAEAHHWRYEVVSARDEGLLLYLRKTHFIEPQLGITEWNAGNLDALVTSAEKAATMMPNLRNAVLTKLVAAHPRDYVLITR